MSEEIRTRIDKAGSKEKLEAIGRELDPAVELDRRKSMDILRAELHAHLDEHGDIEAGDADAGMSDEAGEPDEGATDPEPTPEPDEGATDPEPTPEPAPEAPKYEGKLLQNTRTKRFYPYTAALAKKRNMREV